jgi:adenosylcobinamide-phosphate synthase
VVPAALVVDLAVGDPAFITHPVSVIGRSVSWLERRLRLPGGRPQAAVARGFMLWLVVVLLSYSVAWGLIAAVSSLSRGAGMALSVWLISTTVAARGLRDAGRKVSQRLAAGDTAGARAAVGEIVGRDTDRMDQGEVIRATVESVAENTVDAVVSPMFYALLGGAPLAMAYRAVNTLDSMLGYKDAAYLYFGRAAARLDDLANYIPARLAGALMCLAALFLGLDWRRAISVRVRDAVKHPSPNAGVPESVAAGALGLQLGGLNAYDGRPRMRALLGDKTREFEQADIARVTRLMLGSSVLAAGLFALIRVLVSSVM